MRARRGADSEVAARECGCTVSLLEIAAHIGADVDHTRQRIRERGFTEVTNWKGEPALAVFDAAELIAGWTELIEEHSNRWARYEAYRKQRKADAARQRAEAYRTAIKAVRERASKKRKVLQEEAERMAHEAAKRAADARADVDGSPVSFDQFSPTDEEKIRSRPVKVPALDLDDEDDD